MIRKMKKVEEKNDKLLYMILTETKTETMKHNVNLNKERRIHEKQKNDKLTYT